MVTEDLIDYFIFISLIIETICLIILTVWLCFMVW